MRCGVNGQHREGQEQPGWFLIRWSIEWIRRGSIEKIPADHYRHTRPAYDCELLRKGLLQETEENDAVASDAEPAHGDD